MVSAYSTGPVAPSDRVGSSNASLIMMASCTSQGRLLQPSRPATAIDACFEDAAFSGGPKPLTKNNYPIFSTHTAVSGSKWAHVFAIGLADGFTVTLDMIPVDCDASQVRPAAQKKK